MTNDVIGAIDLGTTFSAGTYVTVDGVLTPLTDGKSIPSVVWIRGDEVVVGTVAMNRWSADRDHTIRWVKRSMGDPNWLYPRNLLFSVEAFAEIDNALQDETLAGRKLLPLLAARGVTLSENTVVKAMVDRWTLRDGQVGYVARLNGGQIDVWSGMSAVEISAEILKAIKSAMEQELGQPIDNVVITCPAYFSSEEAANTRRAGELAGFTVKEIIREPVAAAVAHGVDALNEGQRSMVCDLGGGTFDATILERKGGQLNPVATVGDRMLGGHDWTSALVELVADRVRDQGAVDPRQDPSVEQRLYEDCERAKRDFSSLTEQVLTVPSGGQLRQITITRADFESRTEPMITQMLTTCANCLAKASLTWRDVDQVLMVGGSSRLRRMSEALAEASGRVPVLARTPDTMVVNGAAMMARGFVRTRPQAGGLSVGRVGGITTVNPGRRTVRDLGTRVFDRQQRAVVNVLVMPRNVEVPCRRSRDDFEVSVDDQKYFDIPVVEYEEQQFDANVYLEPVGNYRFFCGTHAKRGDRISVTLGYDGSQICFAEAKELRTGRPLQVEKAEYREPDVNSQRGAGAPRWVIFALDVSYSMETAGKIGTAKQVLIDKARELLAVPGGMHRVGVVTFGSGAQCIVAPTTDINAIERHVTPITVDGSTPMDAGLDESARALAGAPAGVEREVVLVTDGMPDSQASTSTAASRVSSGGLKLSVLGIGKNDVDEAYLLSLTPHVLVVDATSMAAGLDSLLSIGGSAGAQEGGLMEGGGKWTA